MSDNVKGYEIKRLILFENDRGFALGENPQAVQPFATWQFTEENGKCDYYWGHYTSSSTAATRDYENRVAEHQHEYGVSEKSAYKYYSTQRPVDIGTFPKTENGPLRLVNFDSREDVEQSQFKAWGYLVYDAPLTEKQISDYELRAAPGNPDQLRFTPEQLEQQTQVAGKWEQSKRIPDKQRLTWCYSDFGSFVKKEFVTNAKLSEHYEKVMESKAHTAQKRADKKPISAQLAEGAEQAAKDNADRPTPSKSMDKDR